jgi:hypothetical protein
VVDEVPKALPDRHRQSPLPHRRLQIVAGLLRGTARLGARRARSPIRSEAGFSGLLHGLRVLEVRFCRVLPSFCYSKAGNGLASLENNFAAGVIELKIGRQEIAFAGGNLLGTLPEVKDEVIQNENRRKGFHGLPLNAIAKENVEASAFRSNRRRLLRDDNAGVTSMPSMTIVRLQCRAI